MDRYSKRKAKRILENISIKAKRDMGVWLDTLTADPTVEEMNAWKAGYIAGINRLNINKENE